jgi:hypothetical protein
MYYKKFPVSRFSPSIQEMCRLPYHFHSYDDSSEPIDYVSRFSLTDDDIPDLLSIADWLGRDTDMNGCFDAPLHAWEALSLLDPRRVVPGMLNLLNHLDWANTDHLLEFLCDQLALPAERSAEEARETGNPSLDTIPLVLNAIKEDERYSTTRMLLSDALQYITADFPEHRSEYYRILYDSLKELRIDCRDWYATIVCDLAFQEDAVPETIALLEKACREGYAETYRFWTNDGMVEKAGFDYNNDPELLVLHAKSRKTLDILSEFRHCNRKFPNHAMQKARELRDWIVPNLIEVIRDATVYARFGVPNRDRSVQFAVHLLAEFQAKESLPAIFDSLSLSIDEIWDHLYADGYFESMPGILNRLIGDEPDFYDQKLRDPQVPVALQCCLLRSVRYLVARNVVSEEMYGNWLREYLEIAIETKKTELVTDLVCDILHVANPDDITLVRTAYDKELVDEDRMPWEEAEEEINDRKLSIAQMLPDPKRDFSDAVEEMSSWAWFRQKSPSLPQKPTLPPMIDLTKGVSDNVLHLSSKSIYPEEQSYEGNMQPRKAVTKIGRNDPCPCGSGKKYKKCCMEK